MTGTMVIKGHRNSHNGLWHVPLAPQLNATRNFPVSQQCHSAIYNQNTKADLAGFIHACLFSPTPSTLLRAIRNGHLTTFPGLYSELISKHLPKSLATSAGHMRMQQQGIRSTKEKPPPIDPAIPIETSLDIAPSQEPQNRKTNKVYVTIVTEENVKKSYSDQTGRFPHQSSRGNEYVFILYNYDSNSIHSVPIPNRQAATIRDAWVSTFKKL